jgi:phenylacetate-CoA ligase
VRAGGRARDRAGREGARGDLALPEADLSASTLELARLLAGRLPGGAELEAIRLRRLRRLVEYAWANVPYYRALWERAGFEPRDLRSVADLRRLPITTRDELRAAGPDGVGRGVDLAACRAARTSGSTGKPWTVYRTHGEHRLRRALEFRSMRCAGVEPRDVMASLGPLRDVPRSPLRWAGLYRTLQVSPLAAVGEQIRRLREIRPSVLWVYPSALRALLGDGGTLASVIEPRMVITSAEPLDDLLRRRAGADDGRFVTRNFYGSVEIGRIAWQCAVGDGLHVNADSVILELEDDRDVPGAGKSVVATNLLSHAMPFIRYRLGDLCEPLEGDCPCGAPLPRIKAPVGRDWDVIRLPSGRLLSPWGFNVYVRALDGLLQFRFVQTSLDRLRVLLRFSTPPAAGTLAAFREQLLRHVGEPMRIDLELVDAFEEGALKFRSFLSELQPPSR